MTRRHVAGFLLIAMVGDCTCAGAVPTSPICPKADGMVGGPYVPTKDAAAKIYLVVAKAMFPDLFPGLQKKYPIVSVEDQGNRWVVGQSRPKPAIVNRVDDQGREIIVVQAGGGMLGMSIDKCTGAISDMSFAR